ncbi:periplasmic protein [Campylobacter fetus subsp. testudinum]|uniref:Periplasmic protein n=1 Tax=Campylobacter fetus subsp. testudinum TaxID=1507806 RepID=A0AAX0HF90_CAMFE|nr:LPS-assembly protein LptD [Campylobacter fetus]OCR91722.1 periplasmic protein [Campylobacter fetus subsp. testudinum]OCR95756.1 periplasmic protein [Campylobacter fetus subsp. testudinum]
MLIKKILLSFLFVSSLFARVENVEFLADRVEKDGNIVNANGNVLVYSQNYLVTADRAIYDQKSETIELFGNVNMLRGDSETSRSNYVMINLKTNDLNFDGSFAMDKDKEIWIQSDESCSTQEAYFASKSIVSSCNVQDPDWHINFSSGELNKQSKFMHLYNPVFYIKDMPVFYIPYFGFSTDKTRRTGFLSPQIAYSKSNGVMYLQPFYIAIADEWDLEFDPQIRTNRGSGIYSTFRFADSPYSGGLIRSGIFNEKNSYKEKENLKNTNHTGFEVQYDRDRLVKYLIDGDFTEGLWLRYTKLNDIDYLNLRGKKNGDYDSLVQSKLNYFITTDENYFGAYAKYYIDTAKISSKYGNDDTLQELPKLQYHSFTSTFIVPNLIYSFDAKYHNYTRNIGTRASQYEIDFPVGLNFNILDDYANFSVTENIYATHIAYKNNRLYTNGEFIDDNFNDYINHYHKFLIETDLAKAYDSFYHTINLKLDYIKPGYSNGSIENNLLKYYMLDQSGNNIKLTDSNLFEENFVSGLDKKYSKESTTADFVQFFYGSEGQKFLRHSIKQGFNIDDSDFENLENRLNLYFGNFNFANKIEYSHIDNSLAKIQSGTSYANSRFNVALWHTYDKNSDNKLIYDKESYLSSSLSINLPRSYRLFAGFDYDVQRSYTKMWRTGINYKRKCWDYSLVYQEDIEPKNTSAGLESKKSQGFYLYFSFYPLGGVGYDFSIEQNNEAKQ